MEKSTSLFVFSLQLLKAFNVLNVQYCTLLCVLQHFFVGTVTSSNHPFNHPHNLNKTETIQVESNKVLRLEFTSFAVWWGSKCQYDFVKITDGDGTTLMERSCGYSTVSQSESYFFLPPVVRTKTNKVEIFFHTDNSGTSSGWSLTWSAVTPGLNPFIFNNMQYWPHTPIFILCSDLLIRSGQAIRK